MSPVPITGRPHSDIHGRGNGPVAMTASERHVGFPPIRGHLGIATSSRRAALAGLAMYAPCKPWTVLAHRLAWTVVSLLGPAALPGRRTAWAPPTEGDTWCGLLDQWQALLGRLEEFSLYRRRPAGRGGFNVVALREGEPRALVKVRNGDGARLVNEHDALERLRDFGPQSFSIPEPLALGDYAGWHYLALTPLPARPHRPPRDPPLSSIVREVEAALAARPRPAGTPPHWRPMHGDFTPWNLRRLDDGQLVLFDWEDAAWGPPGADETLYRATKAALGADSEADARAGHEEAVAYWSQRLHAEPETGVGSERKVARRLRALLRAAPQRQPRPQP